MARGHHGRRLARSSHRIRGEDGARRLVRRADALVRPRACTASSLEDGRRARTTSAHEVAPPKLPMRLPKAITIDEMAPAARRDRRRRAGPRARQGAARAALRHRRAGERGGGLNVDDLRDRRRSCGCSARAASSASSRSAATPGRRSMPTWCGRGRCVGREGHGDARAVPRAARRRLSRQSAWLVIQAAAERAGLAAHVSPHTLPAQLRHAPAAGRRGRARRAGAARATPRWRRRSSTRS